MTSMPPNDDNHWCAIGHYDAPGKRERPTLPIRMHGDEVFASVAAAKSHAVRLAREYVGTITNDPESGARVRDDDTSDLKSLTSAGYHIRWLKDDDTPHTDTNNGNADANAAQPMTLCLYCARDKSSDWLRWGTVGNAYPVRYYFIMGVRDADDTASIVCEQTSLEATHARNQCNVPQCPNRNITHFHAQACKAKTTTPKTCRPRPRHMDKK